MKVAKPAAALALTAALLGACRGKTVEEILEVR